MCLSIIYTTEEAERIKEVMPEAVEAFKVVCVVGDAYTSVYFRHFLPNKAFLGGLNISQLHKFTGNYLGYHFFVEKNDAQEWLVYHHPTATKKVIRCIVEKSAITKIGKNLSINEGLAFIASEAIFPSYPDTKARWEDLPKETETRRPKIADPTKSLNGCYPVVAAF